MWQLIKYSLLDVT